MNMLVHRDPAEMEKMVRKMEQFCEDLNRLADKMISDSSTLAIQVYAHPLNDLLGQIGRISEELHTLIPQMEALSAQVHSSARYIAQAEEQACTHSGKLLADCTAIRGLQAEIEKAFILLRQELKEIIHYDHGTPSYEKARQDVGIDRVLDGYDELLGKIDLRLRLLVDDDSDEKADLLRLHGQLTERRADFYRMSTQYWNRQQEAIDELARLVQKSRTFIQNYTALLVQGIRAQGGWLYRAASTPTFDQQYDSFEDVRDYLITYHCLPSNYMDKGTAVDLKFKKGRVEINGASIPVSIGGDDYANWDSRLPSFETKYYECDIDSLGDKKRGGQRLVYSDDYSMIFYTDSHYSFFDPVYLEPLF